MLIIKNTTRMKKFGFLVLAVLFLAGCSSTPQDRAEKGVTTFLKKSIAAYEPISFGELETLNLDKLPDLIAARDSLRFYRNALDQIGDQFQQAANQAKVKHFKSLEENLKNFYTGKKYRINHKYKANTAEGKSEEIDKDFYLTDAFIVVE